MPGRSAVRAAFAAWAVAALCLSGCADPSARCKGGLERPTAQLVFGRVDADGAAVSEAQFARFLEQEIGPRFPDGVTVVDAQGRWTPPAGTVIHGPSKMVMIVLRGDADESARLEAVRAAYRRRYNQPSVLRMISGACASF